jgi:hypothetical protein
MGQYNSSAFDPEQREERKKDFKIEKLDCRQLLRKYL